MAEKEYKKKDEIKYQIPGVVVSRWQNRAQPERITEENGKPKIIPAREHEYKLQVAFGWISGKTNLFTGEAKLAVVTVPVEDYKKVSNQDVISCFVRRAYDKYTILTIEGYTVIGVQEEIDADFIEDDPDDID